MKDLIGQRFGRLVVIRDAGRDNNKNVLWLCRCDCGNDSIVRSASLLSGNTRSCGCLHKETFSNKKHDKRYTRLYRIWHHMKDRCCYEQDVNYADYGGRGITICKEWDSSFMAFFEWAMANGYQDDLSIDRIDNDKGYSPDNCRWATMEQQGRNKRNNIVIEYNGEQKTLKEWAQCLDIKYTTLWKRINKGWTIKDAFKAP